MKVVGFLLSLLLAVPAHAQMRCELGGTNSLTNICADDTVLIADGTTVDEVAIMTCSSTEKLQYNVSFNSFTCPADNDTPVTLQQDDVGTSTCTTMDFVSSFATVTAAANECEISIGSSVMTTSTPVVETQIPTIIATDDDNTSWGAGGDWSAQYDESADNQFLITSTNTAAIATTDPMMEILADFGTANGTGMTANQEIFGVAKGTQASNVSLFTVDEDGDVLVAGTAGITGLTTLTGGAVVATTLEIPNTTGSGPTATAGQVHQETDTTPDKITIADGTNALPLGAPFIWPHYYRGTVGTTKVYDVPFIAAGGTADSARRFEVPWDMDCTEMRIHSTGAIAADETVTVEFRKNGTAVYTATIAASGTEAQDVTNVSFVVGDDVQFTRVCTAAPTGCPTATKGLTRTVKCWIRAY